MLAKLPPLCAALILGIMPSFAQERGGPDSVPDDISAPVAYKSLMLVLVTPDGAAAIVFDKAAEADVTYRFRYESRDGKTKRDGTGRVFEKRNERGEVFRNADGGIEGESFIVAGSIKINWSPGTADSGWIYYRPEQSRVHVANAKRFEKSTEINPFGGRREQGPLDLQRFMK